MRSLNRAGFTLIELMVALALTMFLMVIMTECFVLSVDTFTGLKAIGDMQQNLRTACTILQSDLAEDHFEGKRRLSDPTIFNAANPIQAGYFAIKQGSISTPEGMDAFFVPSYRSVNHSMGFTVKRKGNRPENFFSVAIHDPTGGALLGPGGFFFPSGAKSTAYGMFPAPNSPKIPAFPPAVIPKNYVAPASFTNPTPDLPSVTYTMPYTGGNLAFYSSQWAEVYYYLVRMGSTEEPNNPKSVLGTPTYGLYRAQFVMVPDSTNLANVLPSGALATFIGLSCNPDAPLNPSKLIFNSPTDAAYNQGGQVRRAISLPTATYFPIDPSLATFKLADPRLVPRYLGGAGTGQSEGASAAQAQGSAELVCPNVVSFNVQVLTGLPVSPGFVPGSGFSDVPPGAPLGGYLDSSILPALIQAGTVPPFTILGVRATIRVWDNKTRQTRQASVVQDL